MKRLFQLKLRTLLVIMTLLCVAVGYVSAKQQQHQIETVALAKITDRLERVELLEKQNNKLLFTPVS